MRDPRARVRWCWNGRVASCSTKSPYPPSAMTTRLSACRPAGCAAPTTSSTPANSRADSRSSPATRRSGSSRRSGRGPLSDGRSPRGDRIAVEVLQHLPRLRCLSGAGVRTLQAAQARRRCSGASMSPRTRLAGGYAEYRVDLALDSMVCLCRTMVDPILASVIQCVGGRNPLGCNVAGTSDGDVVVDVTAERARRVCAGDQTSSHRRTVVRRRDAGRESRTRFFPDMAVPTGDPHPRRARFHHVPVLPCRRRDLLASGRMTRPRPPVAQPRGAAGGECRQLATGRSAADTVGLHRVGDDIAVGCGGDLGSREFLAPAHGAGMAHQVGGLGRADLIDRHRDRGGSRPLRSRRRGSTCRRS